MIVSGKTDILNIERLIIYTVALLIVVVFILQTPVSILAIVPFTILYFYIIILKVILPFLKNEQQNKNIKNDSVSSFYASAISTNKLKKIAFQNYYYDHEMFYCTNEVTKKLITIPLTNIIEINKTDTMINNVRIWKVIALHNNKKFTCQFKHNYSLQNNFIEFLEELKKKNPNVIIPEFILWNN